MSKAAPAAPPPPPPAPTFLDLFLLTAGFGLSYLLLPLDYPHLSPGATDQPVRIALVRALPGLLRLTEGAILLWPIFHASQRILGRRQALTLAEWLWVLAWLGTATVIGLAACRHWRLLPEFLASVPHWAAFIWYVLVVPSMAFFAVVVLLVGLLYRTPRPWTHALGLALIIWPVLPLAGIMTLSEVKSWGG